MSYALITGASGGIGEELAYLLAEDGHDLVLVARSEGQLARVSRRVEDRWGRRARVIAADLTDPDAAERIHATLASEGIEVDVLVNNAGFGDNSAFLEADWGRLQAMVELNILALMSLSYLFGQDMVRQGRGRILNVASAAAFSAGPYMATYYATKAFVLSFSQALHEELRARGVTVTALCPGPTSTGFERAAGMHDSGMFAHPQSARTVARLGYRAMSRGRTLRYSGPVTRGFSLLARVLPRGVAARLAERVNRS